MEMISLRQLHRSLIAIGSDMQRFSVRTGAACLDFLLSTWGRPFRAHAYGPWQDPTVLPT